MRRSLLGLSVVLVGCAGAEPIGSAMEMVEAMHDRYSDEWYETLTWVQDAIFYDETGAVRDTAQWWEAGHLPGRLRIDPEPLEDGRASVYANDSVYSFRGGELAGARPGLNALLVLGFDVYAQAPARTVEQLETLGFDLTKFRQDEWEGSPVYVVGADAGDTHTQQFWVEQESLFFVRMLQPGGQDGSSTQEVQFNEWVPLGSGFISAEVVFKTDGRVTFVEEYRDMRADVELEDGLFATDRYMPPAWVH